MASPSPKRRRVSPTSASASGDILDEGLRRPPARSSFRSPTKASLARFNPTLIARPRSAGRSSLPQDLGDVLGNSADDPSGDPVKRQLAVENAAAAHDARSRRATDGGASLQSIAEEAMLLGSSSATETAPTVSAPKVQKQQRQESIEQDEDELATPSHGITKAGKSKKPIRNRSLGARLSRSPEKQFAPIRNDPRPLEKLPQRPRSMTVDHATGDNRPVAEADVTVGADSNSNPELEALKVVRDRLQRTWEAMQNRIEKYERTIIEYSSRDPDTPMSDAELTALAETIEENVPEDSEKRGMGVDRPPLSVLLTSFLPFANLSVQQPSPPPTPKNLRSHLPVPLEDPLPHLKLFTSLKPSSALSISHPVEPIVSSLGLYPKHTVTISGPRSHFTSTVDLTLNATKRSVVAMSITDLSPWAEYELGTYIRHRALTCDAGTLFWAMNSYWELATKRAQLWMNCRRDFSDLILQGEAAPSGTVRPRKRRTSQAGIGSNEEDIAGVTHDTDMASTSDRDDLTGMRSNLGRSSLEFRDNHVVMIVTWDIGFDWTGEAESSVKAQAVFPSVWSESDQRASLKRVEETFDRLVEEQGVGRAVAITTRLLFS